MLTEADFHKLVKTALREASVYDGYDSTTTNDYSPKGKSDRKLILLSGEEIDDNYDGNYLTSFERFGHDSFAISNIDSKVFYWADTKNGQEIWRELSNEQLSRFLKKPDFRKWFDGST